MFRGRKDIFKHTMSETTKSCIACGESKDAVADFQKQKNTCKVCTKKRYEARRQTELQTTEDKTCIHCTKTGNR